VNDNGRYRQEHLMMQTFVQDLGPTMLYLPRSHQEMAPGKRWRKTHPVLLKQTSVGVEKVTEISG
jgi:hypothetical protein